MRKVKSILILALVLSVSIFGQKVSRKYSIPVPAQEGCGFGEIIVGVDTDGDGKLEIFAVNNNWNDTPSELIPRIYMYEYNSVTDKWDSVWSAVLSIPMQNTWPTIEFGDLDGDGKKEVIWGPVNYLNSGTNPNPARIIVFEATGNDNEMGVLDGGIYKPNATFTITPDAMTEIRPFRAKLYDINNDGVDEILYADRGSADYEFGVISVNNIPNNGDGSETWTWVVNGKSTSLVNYSAVSHAGTAYDIFAIDSSFYVVQSNGDILPIDYANGTYTFRGTLAGLMPGGSWKTAQVVDLNSNGTKEVIMGGWSSSAYNQVCLLQPSGNTFTVTEIADLGDVFGAAQIYGSSMGDIDNDGNIDFVFGSRGGSPNAAIVLMRNKGGDITQKSNWELHLMDHSLATGGRWDIVKMVNLDADSELEVAYTNGINGKSPITILDADLNYKRTIAANYNMKIQGRWGLFVPGDTIRLTGSFEGWTGAGAPIMTDVDGDSIYTYYIQNLGVDTYEFKGFAPKLGGWEPISNNRKVTVALLSPDTISVSYYWNDVSVYYPKKNLPVTYICNMEYEIGSGRLDPSTEKVELRGSTFGWGPGVEMTRDPVNTSEYYYDAVQFLGTGENVPGYKFWYEPNAWESGDNRTYTITQSEYDANYAEIYRTYNDLNPATLTLNPVDIKYTVYTTGAISAINSQPFTVINTVHICGSASPLGWPGGGWPDGDITVAHQLFDDGTHGDATSGDGTFSVVLNFPKYSPISFEHKYGINYGDAANNQGGNDNENGVGANHITNLNPTWTSCTVVDTFGNMGVSTITDGVGIEGEELLPTVYSLEQNYPNPFNPSTSIKFTIPEAGFVTLKIYNILGQEVATLVNENMNPGTKEIKFNAANLSSGIYIYKLEANKFSATKKMVLLK